MTAPLTDGGAAAPDPVASRPLLSVEGLRAGYRGWEVLRGVDLQLHAGETLGILGHNGAGKTTLLRCIAGLLSPAQGRIAYDGQDISRWSVPRRVQHGIVLVPQGRALFREMSIRDNVMLGAFRKPASEAGRAWEALSQRWDWLRVRQATHVGKLSGGQQQIVANARGLASQPNLLMVDEPSIGLSGVAVSELSDFLSQLRNEGTTTIVVEQNVGLAAKVCDRFMVLRGGEVVGVYRRSELPVEDLWALF